MANFPSKWYDFINKKEIKRLRHDLSDSYSLRVEIAASILIAIASFFLSDYVKEMCWVYQLFIYLIIATVVVCIIFIPSIKKYLSIKESGNVYIGGKEAVSIFDDEIVYDVLVACEYFEHKKEIANNTFCDQLTEFYSIEIEYYIKTSIEKLIDFNSNYLKIFGDGRNRISIRRVDNIISLIDSLVQKVDIKLDENTNSKYSMLCENIKKIREKQQGK